MAAAALLSLADVAKGTGVSYVTATRWARAYGWQPVRSANRTLGRPALYRASDIQRSLYAREVQERTAA